MAMGRWGGAVLMVFLATMAPSAQSQCAGRAEGGLCGAQHSQSGAGSCPGMSSQAGHGSRCVSPEHQTLQAVAASPSRSVDFTYAFEVLDPDPQAREITAWVPLPQDGPFQSVGGWRLDSPWPHMLVRDGEHGNRFLKLDLSDRSRWQDGRIPVTLHFTITRWAQRSGDPGAADTAPGNPAQRWDRFLQPDRLVPVDGEIAREAQRVAGNASGRLQQARCLYDHLVASLDYDKTGSGWGRGDAAYACDVRKGNCTDFHSLFIGEARSLGIPARFVIGFPLSGEVSTGEISGYHCWAEFYDERRGWLPLDASEAHKHPEKTEQLFAGVDEHRIAFTVGRDIVLPGASGGPLNYVVYPHVEVDGHEHRQITKRFSFRDQSGREEKHAQLSGATGS